MLAFRGEVEGERYKNNMSRFSRFDKWSAALLIMLLLGCASGPPVQEMSDARQAIAAVDGAESNQRALQLLTQARALLQSAEAKLRRQAFNGAKVDAVEARRKAIEALQVLQAAESET